MWNVSSFVYFSFVHIDYYFRGLSFGRIDYLGRFESEYEPEPDAEQSGEYFIHMTKSSE